LILALRERRLLHRQRGFTLIELLVVLAILAILAAIVTFGVITFLKTANLNACKQEKSTVQAALDSMLAATSQTKVTAAGPTNDFSTVPAEGKLYDGIATDKSYLRTNPTKFKYSFDVNGKVTAAEPTDAPAGCNTP
jgi:general secretion pathway protein G